MSSSVTKLMLLRLDAQDGERAEVLYTHYINQIYPDLGAHYKATDVASIALVIGLVYKKPEIAQSAIEILLGGSEMKLKELQNEILLYNLACYYADQGDNIHHRTRQENHGAVGLSHDQRS